MQLLHLLCIFVLFLAYTSARALYSGERVVQVITHNDTHVEDLWKYALSADIDIWSPSLKHVRVNERQELKLNLLGYETKPFISDLQQAVDEFFATQRAAISKADANFFDAYHNNDDVLIWIEQMAGEYSEILYTESVGETYEKRGITSVVIHGKEQPGDVPTVVFIGGAHAREWITVSTTLWIIKELCEGYGNDPEITRIVDEVQFVIVPIANPDGYEYTWSNQRLWRKNREATSVPTCFGTDTNRNWPYRWNTGGSSSNPCSDTYHGASAGSTLEVAAMMKYIESKSNVKGFIDFHSYSQLIMSPWGFTRTYPPEYSDMKGVMDDAVARIRAVNGLAYRAGSIANIIYIASGGSVDWTLGQLGIKYSLAYELRDTGRYGFLLPPNQIIPQAEEIMPAVIAFANVILEE